MSKTDLQNVVMLLKNENGAYFIELSPEQCEQYGMIEGIEYDLTIVENCICITKARMN